MRIKKIFYFIIIVFVFILLSSGLILRIHYSQITRSTIATGKYFLRTEPKGGKIYEHFLEGESYTGISPGPFNLKNPKQAHTFIIRLLGYKEVKYRVPPNAYENSTSYPTITEPAIALPPKISLVIPVLYFLRDHIWGASINSLFIVLYIIFIVFPKLQKDENLLLKAEKLKKTIVSEGIKLEEYKGLAGSIIGSYRLLEELGKGGMSVVYKGVREEDFLKHAPEYVAIKIIERDLSFNPKIETHFNREVEVWKSLHHPNIVHLYEWGEEGKLFYLVLELVEGGDIRRLFKPDGISLKEALPLMRQIFVSLDCIHKKGITHRDIKPENFLITDKGLLKLTDFGIAKAPSSKKLTTTGNVIGTPLYISPEQINALPATSKSDLYSAGVICYELLTGINPFASVTQVETLIKHIRGNIPEIKASIPEKLKTTIFKLLSQDPNERPGAEEVIKILGALKDNADK